MSRTSRFVLAIGLLFTAALPARAQLPIHFSANAGIAKPISNEADLYNSGFHLGIGAKVALVPLQFDAAYDHFGAQPSNRDDLNIASVGVTVPISLTPSLLPVSVYALAGGGIYHHSADTAAGADLTGNDVGVNGGVGVRVGIPGISLFAEGRGVLVASTANKLSYLTAAIGLRF